MSDEIVKPGRLLPWLCATAFGLMILALAGCARQPMSLPATEKTLVEQPASERQDSYQESIDCNNEVYLVPTNIISNAQRVDADWQGPDNRFDEQGGWLSLHLDLPQSTVQFGEPIPLLLTFTNERISSVIFARPQYIIFDNEYGAINRTSRLVVDVNSTSRRKLNLDLMLAEALGYIPPPAQEFTLLAPGQSCSIKMPLDWNSTALEEPIPPGDYTLRAFSEHFDPGPRVSDRSSEMWDIDAWVGYTKASNVLTFTVLPPKQ